MSRVAADRNEPSVVTDDGVRLHARGDGPVDAPALLLCNSLGTDHTSWDQQMSAWGVDRRVLRFDQRGHGASEVGATPYTLERLVRDAVAVLDAFEVERADVCGISLGGMVALRLAANAPERVGRVVAADTAIRVGTEDGWRARADLVRQHGMAAVRDAVLERFFSPGFRASAPAEVERAAEMLLACDPEGYARSCEALATGDLSDELSRVRSSVLVVVGAEDVATTPSDAAALTAALPDARLTELEDAGHLAHIEAPERFARVVLDHLGDPTSVERAGPGAVARADLDRPGGTT